MASKKRHVACLATAIAMSAGLCLQANAAEKSYEVIDRGMDSKTVMEAQPANASNELEPATKPFSTKMETRPAGTAVVGEHAVGDQMYPDVVNYASTIEKRTPQELVLHTTISKAEDDAVLSRLANKIYKENHGEKYQNVTIYWHVGQNPEPLAPWARTDIAKGGDVYEIIKSNQ